MFEAALFQAVEILKSAQKRGLLQSYALIGGLAVARWGSPRATGDIDFVIRCPIQNLEKLATVLDGKATIGDLQGPLVGSISFNISDPVGAIPVQLLVFPKALEEAAFENIGMLKIREREVPLVDWAGLVMLKLYAGGAFDLEDARSILLNVKPTAIQLTELESKARRLRLDRRLRKIL